MTRREAAQIVQAQIDTYNAYNRPKPEPTKAERQTESFRNALIGMSWVIGAVIVAWFVLSLITHPVSVPDSDCDAYTTCSQ
jgi:hypothetical protein